ncbi:hypothetical protein ISS03_03470 [Patescibacteria group bacterium]|nr:hypothetical protein [Patescibacteria group bacterium]
MIHNILKMYYKNFFSAYVIFLLFLLVFHGHIVGFLKLTNNTHLWFMAAFFALNLILIPLMSLLEGLNRFGHRYFATFLGDLSLITSTCVFLYFHFSIEKAFLAKLSPMVVGIIAMVFFYRRDKVINGSDDVSKPLNEQGKLESKNLLSFLQIGLGPICMTIILNIDMMIARVTLSSTDSGTYATISILGKALFFFATVNLPLFYVKCNEAFFKKANILIIILKGFGYTTILSISGLVGLWIIIDLFILLLNPIYVNDTGLVLYYALSMIPYAFVQMMITLFMSFNTYKAFFVLLIMTMIQVIILFLSPHDILTIVNIRLYSGLVFCVVLVYFIVKIIFHQKSESKV